MFHVKHGVPTTNQLFHVKRRERMRSSGTTNRVFTDFMAVWLFHVKRRMGWLSYGGMVFENCFHPIVVEELVFHVEPENSRKFFLNAGGMRLDFSIGHNA